MFDTYNLNEPFDITRQESGIICSASSHNHLTLYSCKSQSKVNIQNVFICS